MIGRSLREKAAWTLTFVGGLYYILKFTLPEVIRVRSTEFTFSGWDDQISLGIQAVSVMAVGLGIVNVLMVHGGKIAYRRAGKTYSAVLLGGMVIMMASGTATWVQREKASRELATFSNLRLFAERIVADESSTPPPPPLPLSSRVKAFLRASDAALSVAGRPVAVDFDARTDLRVRAAREDLLDRRLKVAALVESLRECIAAASSTTCGREEFLKRLSAAGAGVGSLGSVFQSLDAFRLENTQTQKCYQFLYEGLFVALSSAMFSLLAFYIASAAFRAFRIRSAESAVMMGTALIVMLGQIPFGIWLWEDLPAVRLWLLTVPSSGARRAIEFGAGMAGLIMAFRVWLSIETRGFGARRQS